MAKVELGKSKDGRATVLRIRDASLFPENPSVQIAWIAYNKSLGTKGWQQEPYDIPSRSQRAGKDLLITLEAAVTNHIQPGTPVEISIPVLELSDQLLWPVQLLGAERWDTAGPSSFRELNESADIALLEQAQAEAAEARAKLRRCEDDLKAARNQLQSAPMQGAGEAKETSSTSPRFGWSAVAAALVVGIAVGTASMYGLSKAIEVRAPGGTDTANVQADLARLKDEAFAPLANDLITVAARSPNGMTPEEALQGFAVGDSARELDERGRAFLNRGLDSARDGNKMEATYWYRQSLRRCAGDSLLYLGDAYLNGDGATRDTRTGFQLVRFASALGATRATDLVRNMLRQGQSIPLAPPALADRYQTRQ